MTQDETGAVTTVVGIVGSVKIGVLMGYLR